MLDPEKKASPDKGNGEHDFEFDRAYLNSLREMFVMLGVWAICLSWTIGYCWLFGYTSTDETHGTGSLWGFPPWVTIGVIIPWILCGLFSIVFALFGIADDDEDLLPPEQAAKEGGDVH